MGQKQSIGDADIEAVHGSSVMVSFSRKDEEVVNLINESLTTEKRKVWIDWEAIPPSESFLDEICKAIEGTDCFLFIMSPDSIKSELCNWEITYALAMGKRIIPLVCRDVDTKDVRKEIMLCDWIMFRPGTTDSFEKAMQTLLHALDDNFAHVAYHTKFLTRAIVWKRHAFSHTALLTGDNLKRARHWLESSSRGVKPKPTSLHISYIASSEQHNFVMNVRKTVAVFIAFVVGAGCIWPSWGVFFFGLIFSLVFIYFTPN